MSTKTGMAPTCAMASAVAKKVKGVVMTSSPLPMPMAARIRNSASVPWPHATACLVPQYAAMASSSSLTLGPPMKPADAIVPRTASSSSSLSDRYWAFRSSRGTPTMTFSFACCERVRGVLLVAEQLLGRDVADHLGRDTHDELARRDVVRHHGAGRHERFLAYLDAGQDVASAADARSAADGAAAKVLETLGRPAHVVVIGGHDHRCDEAVLLDKDVRSDVGAGLDLGVRPDLRVVLDGHAPADHDAIADGAPLANTGVVADDAARAERRARHDHRVAADRAAFAQHDTFEIAGFRGGCRRQTGPAADHGEVGHEALGTDLGVGADGHVVAYDHSVADDHARADMNERAERHVVTDHGAAVDE